MSRQTIKNALSALTLGASLSLAAPPASAAVETSGYLDLGVEQQKADWLMLIEPGFHLRSPRFDMDLAVPLRLDMTDGFNVWIKDWDHLSDVGRVMRNASLTMNDGAFRLKLGVLAHTTFGHGTMVQGFISTLDPDTMPMGASLFIQTGAITIEAMASDVFGPQVLGGSFAIEPVTLTGTNYDRMHLIASFVADPMSPGAYREDGTQSGDDWVFMYGFAVDWAIVRNERWQLAPYVDFNVNGKGYGVHAGAMADLFVSKSKLSMRAEWRWAQAPYAPDYFDLAYSIERRDYVKGSLYPISQAIALEDRDPNHSGKIELRVESGAVSASAVFAGIGHDVFNSSLVLNAKVWRFDLSLFGALRHFKFGQDPDRTLAMGEVRYRISRYFHTWLSAGQLYRFNDEDHAKPMFLWSTGIGAAVQFSGHQSHHH